MSGRDHASGAGERSSVLVSPCGRPAPAQPPASTGIVRNAAAHAVSSSGRIAHPDSAPRERRPPPPRCGRARAPAGSDRRAEWVLAATRTLTKKTVVVIFLGTSGRDRNHSASAHDLSTCRLARSDHDAEGKGRRTNLPPEKKLKILEHATA